MNGKVSSDNILYTETRGERIREKMLSFSSEECLQALSKFPLPVSTPFKLNVQG